MKGQNSSTAFHPAGKKKKTPVCDIITTAAMIIKATISAIIVHNPYELLKILTSYYYVITTITCSIIMSRNNAI